MTRICAINNRKGAIKPTFTNSSPMQHASSQDGGQPALIGSSSRSSAHLRCWHAGQKGDLSQTTMAGDISTLYGTLSRGSRDRRVG